MKNLATIFSSTDMVWQQGKYKAVLKDTDAPTKAELYQELSLQNGELGQNAVLWFFDAHQPGLAQVSYEAREQNPGGRGLIFVDPDKINYITNVCVAFPITLLPKHCCQDLNYTVLIFPRSTDDQGFIAAVHKLKNHRCPGLPLVNENYPLNKLTLQKQEVTSSSKWGLIEPLLPAGRLFGLYGNFILYQNFQGLLRIWESDTGLFVPALQRYLGIRSSGNVLLVKSQSDPGQYEYANIGQTKSGKLTLSLNILRKSLLSQKANVF